ncbi:MAG: 2-oxo acid dehydrogenase subunit E2, partial [Pseudomonadota bacterium]|nr:2-oxo acid dehydrogenase subunit E2 [Pseudomonadota bacterium]
MSTEIKVPVLGESVVEATVSQWMKAKGDAVQADEPIVELETDKVTLEVPSPVAGVLEDIVAAEGSTVGVDALLAVVAEGKAAAAQPASAPAKDTSTPAPAAPATPAPATPAPAAPSAPATGAAMTLSPAVRKLVEEHQLNPAAIRATGKDGRLTKADVKAAIDNGGARNAAAPASAAPVSAPAVARPDDPREERVPMSRLRRIIASRLKDAQNTAAMLTTFNEVDMSAVMALRSEYKDEFEKNHGARLGFMGFFVKAVITALTEFPAVNAEIHGDDIIYKNFYNIGVAVGTPQGLVVPVLKDAQHMGLADI